MEIGKGMNLDFILANEIKYIIMEKKLKEGDCLPSERELCAYFNVQRLTVRSALHLLEEEGMIYSKPKSGYYVDKPRILINAKKIVSMTDELFSMPVNASTKLLSFEKTEVNKRIIGCLKLPIGTPVYMIRRLRIVEEEPVCVDCCYIPAERCPDLDRYDLEHHSLYRILGEEYHIKLKESEQLVDVVWADKEILSLLQLQGKEKVVFQHGSVFDEEGRLIDYSENYMKPNRFIYES